MYRFISAALNAKLQLMQDGTALKYQSVIQWDSGCSNTRLFLMEGPTTLLTQQGPLYLPFSAGDGKKNHTLFELEIL